MINSSKIMETIETIDKLQWIIMDFNWVAYKMIIIIIIIIILIVLIKIINNTF